jgi:hypothetical protein
VVEYAYFPSWWQWVPTSKQGDLGLDFPRCAVFVKGICRVLGIATRFAQFKIVSAFRSLLSQLGLLALLVSPHLTPAEREMKNCSICGVESAPYRCRRCSARYCSSSCSQRHASEQQCQQCQSTVRESPRKREREPDLEGPSPQEDPDVLSKVQLERLSRSREMRMALRNSALQKLLLTIDASKSSLDALDAARVNVPTFNRFCVELLSIIQPPAQ